MISALTLPGEVQSEALGRESVALGISSRWSFQNSASTAGITVVADAELVNRPELEKLVQSATTAPANLSTSALLSWLYRLRGISFLELLDGAFSFALWDDEAGHLLLGLDRVGVNSIYWRQEGARILFGTRVGALRAVQSTPAEVNRAALIQYMLLSAVPAPHSIYVGTNRLLPGHYLLYKKGTARQVRYCDIDYIESDEQSISHWSREVREGIRSAVRASLDGLSPERTGAYLSGGTDSSSVVAFMSEAHAPVKTFSIFFDEAPYSEIEFARTTAKHFCTEHHELSLKSYDAYEAIPKIVNYYDEPFANSSAIGSYFCARMAADAGVQTLLAGDGGDELFAGNERYATDKRFALYEAIPKWIRKGLVEPIATFLPANGGKLGLPRRYIRRANIPLPRRLFSYNFLLTEAPESIFEVEMLSAVPAETWLETVETHFKSAPAQSDLNRFLYLDMKVTLGDNDLRKVLGTAELAGVRSRFPLLDKRLIELAAKLPVSLKMRGFQKRFIFKEAMKEILPRKVLNKKKHGFGVPISLWFLRDPQLATLVKDVLRDPRTRQRGYFKADFLDRLFQLHQGPDAHYFGEILWYVVALELWHREHLERTVETVCAR